MPCCTIIPKKTGTVIVNKKNFFTMNSEITPPSRKISRQSQKIICNVHDFMVDDAQEILLSSVFFKSRYLKVNDRVSRATKVSLKNVEQILNEEKYEAPAPVAGSSTQSTHEVPGSSTQSTHEVPGSSTQSTHEVPGSSTQSTHEVPGSSAQSKNETPMVPPIYRKTCEPVILDAFTYQFIRRKVYEIQLVDQETITVRSCLDRLLNEIPFHRCPDLLRQIWKQLDFKFEKHLLIEKNRVRLRRRKFLQQIKQYRNEGRDIIYGDVTCMHSSKRAVWRVEVSKGIQNEIPTGPRLIIFQAANSNGFLANAFIVIGDCHSQINREIYESWLWQRLLPNIKPNSVFVVDKLSYNRTIEEKLPNSTSARITMQDWLASKNIAFDPDSLQPELYDIIKQHKHLYKKHSLDTIMEANGHKVLVLPPFHEDLNPLENIWDKIKKKVEIFWCQIKEHLYKNNVALNCTHMLRLTEIYAEISREEWHQAVNKAMRCEDEFMAIENAIDVKLDELVRDTEYNYWTGGSTEWSSDDSSSSDTSDKLSAFCIPIVTDRPKKQLLPSTSDFKPPRAAFVGWDNIFYDEDDGGGDDDGNDDDGDGDNDDENNENNDNVNRHARVIA